MFSFPLLRRRGSEIELRVNWIGRIYILFKAWKGVSQSGCLKIVLLPYVEICWRMQLEKGLEMFCDKMMGASEFG